MNSITHLLLLTTIAVVGLLTAVVLGWHGVEKTFAYSLLASVLLCFGLYMAVFGIDKREAKQHWRVVVIAVTFGVLCKYLFIFGVIFAITHDWRYAVIGMAVAQIDPLSVAALQNDKRMSPAIRTILNMWASFDDPMTALLTPLLLGVTANILREDITIGDSWSEVLVKLIPFIAVLLLIAIWALYRRTRSSKGGGSFPERVHRTSTGTSLATASLGRLYSIAALTGWFFRPKWLEGARGVFITNCALYGATFLLGILLARGVDWYGGIWLGVATYSSQVIAAWLVIRVGTRGKRKGHRFSKRDTWHLALSQQNGITAIVLALNLEPVISGSIAVVSLAILTVNTLHACANWIFDRFIEPKFFTSSIKN